MAKVDATVVELRAQGDRMVRAFDKVDRRFNKLDKRLGSTSRAARRASRSMRDFGGSFSYFKFAAITGGLAAIAGTFHKIRKNALDYDRALVGVTKTTNITGLALESMRAQFNQLSVQLGVSRTEIAKIAEIAGQLGVNGSRDLLAFTETVTKLTLTTDLTGEAASLALARLLKLTKTDIATGIKDVSNAIVELGNNVAARESEITDFAVGLASEFGQFGFAATEVVAFGGALAAMQGHAQAAATAMQKMLRQITSLTADKNRAKLEGFARLMKMSVGDTINAIENDLANLTANFLTRLDDFDSSSRGEILSTYANLADAKSQKQIPRLTAMIEETRGHVQRGVEEGRAVDFEVAARTRSTSGQFDIQTERLSVAFDDLGRQINESLLPAFRGLADFVTWFAKDRDAIERFNKAMKNFGDLPEDLRAKVRNVIDENGNVPGTDVKAGPQTLEAVSDLIEKRLELADVNKSLENLRTRSGPSEAAVNLAQDIGARAAMGDKRAIALQQGAEGLYGSFGNEDLVSAVLDADRETLLDRAGGLREELEKIEALFPNMTAASVLDAEKKREREQQAYEDAEKARIKQRNADFKSTNERETLRLEENVAAMRGRGEDEAAISFVRAMNELRAEERAARHKWGEGAGEGGYGQDQQRLEAALAAIVGKRDALLGRDNERLAREGGRDAAAREREQDAQKAEERILAIARRRYENEQELAMAAFSGADAATMKFLETVSKLQLKLEEAEGLDVDPEDEAAVKNRMTVMSQLTREINDVTAAEAQRLVLEKQLKDETLAQLQASLEDERKILKLMRSGIEEDALEHAARMISIERWRKEVESMPEDSEEQRMAKETETARIEQEEERLKRAKEALEKERQRNDEAAQWADLLDAHLTRIFEDILAGTEDVKEGFARMFDAILYELERKLIVDPIVDALTGKIEEILRKALEDAGQNEELMKKGYGKHGGGIDPVSALMSVFGGGGPSHQFAGIGSGSSGGSDFGNLLLSGAKMIFGAPGAAEGGTIRNPGMVIVGEQGPEVLSLPRGATITPLAESGGAGGGVVHNWNITSEDRVAMRRVVEEMMPDISRASQGDFIKSTRSGNGPLARHMRGR